MAALEARQARAVDTRNKLMRAMEKLSAEKGSENVSVKELIEEAGQKNESVLQYHFGSKAGLLTAIHKARFTQTQVKRRKMLAECLAENASPSVRDLCHLMVGPTFQLCKSDMGHRQWVEAWGAKNAALVHPSLEEEAIDEGNSVQIIKSLFKSSLPHLDDTMFENRCLNVIRFSNLSMSNQAREKAGFSGRKAELFLCNLVDLLVGMFKAEVSDETELCLRR
ncbi:MAG: TetR/AcrR family transcriptional regulator [Pseudomonadota bacterium]|nr:TetR/AcrR family transcriptional regulator [Pseudomonadota bacterium]